MRFARERVELIVEASNFGAGATGAQASPNNITKHRARLFIIFFSINTLCTLFGIARARVHAHVVYLGDPSAPCAAHRGTALYWK